MKILLFLIVLILALGAAGIFISVHFGVQIAAVPTFSGGIPLISFLTKPISDFFDGFRNMINGKF